MGAAGPRHQTIEFSQMQLSIRRPCEGSWRWDGVSRQMLGQVGGKKAGGHPAGARCQGMKGSRRPTEEAANRNPCSQCGTHSNSVGARGRVW